MTTTGVFFLRATTLLDRIFGNFRACAHERKINPSQGTQGGLSPRQATEPRLLRAYALRLGQAMPICVQAFVGCRGSGRVSPSLKERSWTSDAWRGRKKIKKRIRTPINWDTSLNSVPHHPEISAYSADNADPDNCGFTRPAACIAVITTDCKAVADRRVSTLGIPEHQTATPAQQPSPFSCKKSHSSGGEMSGDRRHNDRIGLRGDSGHWVLASGVVGSDR